MNDGRFSYGNVVSPVTGMTLEESINEILGEPMVERRMPRLRADIPPEVFSLRDDYTHGYTGPQGRTITHIFTDDALRSVRDTTRTHADDALREVVPISRTPLETILCSHSIAVELTADACLDQQRVAVVASSRENASAFSNGPVMTRVTRRATGPVSSSMQRMHCIGVRNLDISIRGCSYDVIVLLADVGESTLAYVMPTLCKSRSPKIIRLFPGGR